MNMDEDKKIKLGCFISFVVVLVLVLSFFLYMLLRPAPVYETNNIADYGIVKGNYDNDSPKRYISSFFPEKIEDYFSDITYHYKAKKLDTYAFEMYLEFEIQDTDKYASFISNISNVIGNEVSEPFYFAPAYQAYYISNYLTIFESNDEDRPPYIENALIGLVLFSEEEQRIIFLALGMYDGGGANAEELGFFFNRFEIDPLEYEERTTPGNISLSMIYKHGWNSSVDAPFPFQEYQRNK